MKEQTQYVDAEDTKSIKLKNDPNGLFLEIMYKMDNMKWTGCVHKTYINTKTGYITGYDVKLY